MYGKSPEGLYTSTLHRLLTLSYAVPSVSDHPSNWWERPRQAGWEFRVRTILEETILSHLCPLQKSPLIRRILTVAHKRNISPKPLNPEALDRSSNDNLASPFLYKLRL